MTKQYQLVLIGSILNPSAAVSLTLKKKLLEIEYQPFKSGPKNKFNLRSNRSILNYLVKYYASSRWMHASPKHGGITSASLLEFSSSLFYSIYTNSSQKDSKRFLQLPSSYSLYTLHPSYFQLSTKPIQFTRTHNPSSSCVYPSRA